MTKKLYLALALAILIPAITQATTHAITPNGGTLGTTGVDWDHACRGFTGNCAGSAMLRGDTYYVAGGSGGAYTNAANAPVLRVTTIVSGTIPITIKAATIADHGPATGWVNTLAVDGGAGQADFVTAGNAVFEASTNYVVFDGNFAATDTSATWNNPGHACASTQCGIMADQRTSSTASASTHNTYGVFIDASVTNITVRSMELWGPGKTAGDLGIGTDFIRSPSGGSGYLFTHNYMHDSSQTFFQILGSSGTVISYNYLFKNYSRSGGTLPLHGSCIETSGNTNLTVAFNAFQDDQGTACLSELGSGITSSSGYLFYGNIISMTSGNPNGLAGGYDNGIISCTNGQVCTGWKAYNNTIVNETLSTNNSLNGGSPVGAGSSIDVRNNLFLNSAGTNNQCVNWTGSCTYDYQYYSGTTQNTPGAHDQTTSVNPLVNWPGGNFQLVADTSLWFALASPFNVDGNGILRSSSRGAFQFVTSNPPAAPISLAGTVSGSTVSLSWTASAGTPVPTGYTLYRGAVHNGPYAAVKSGLTSTSTTDTPIANGTYFYVVTAFVGGVVSSITGNGTVGTVTCAAVCSFPNGTVFTIAGNSQASFNGTFITSTGQPTTSTITFNTSVNATGTGGGVWQPSSESARSNEISATTPAALTLLLAPSSLTFTSQTVGTPSGTQTVVVMNTSSTGSTVTFSSVTFAGTNPGDFSRTTTCTTLTVNGQTCNAVVTFTPTAAGARSALLTFVDNATGSPQTIPVSGTGVAATPGVSLAPTSLNFQSQTLSTTSVAQSIILTNTGTGNLTVTSVVATGDFAVTTVPVTSCGTTLAPLATCSLNVTFTPTATGGRTGAVTVTDNAAGSPHVATLQGIGITTKCAMSGNIALSGVATVCQ